MARGMYGLFVSTIGLRLLRHSNVTLRLCRKFEFGGVVAFDGNHSKKIENYLSRRMLRHFDILQQRAFSRVRLATKLEASSTNVAQMPILTIDLKGSLANVSLMSIIHADAFKLLIRFVRLGSFLVIVIIGLALAS